MYRVAINGFGRIGRTVCRVISQGGYADLYEIAAINARRTPAELAHQLKYDSTYGRLPVAVDSTPDGIVIDGQPIRIVNDRDPSNLPWRELGIDLVIESTGKFTDAIEARRHLDAGAKKVIITAPATNEDITVVIGVNDDAYDPARDHVISNASCTTNCVAPVVSVLHENFGVSHAMMTTVHAFTADQALQDGSHDDLRRGRGAAQNIVPTTTGAARAVGLVLPELKGRIDGFALRVPTPSVSIVNLVAVTERPVSVASVNAVFEGASRLDRWRGVLACSDEPLVSSDYRGDRHSATVDRLSTMTTGDRLVNVVAWYDNEWGYSCRVADLAAIVCQAGIPRREPAAAMAGIREDVAAMSGGTRAQLPVPR